MLRAIAFLLSALLCACAPGGAVSPGPGAAPIAGFGPSVPDQAWAGRLRCAPMEEVSRELDQAVRIDVRGGVARMERDVFLSNTAISSGFREVAEGPVAPDGGVELAGRGFSRSASYRASYRGVLSQERGRAELTGGQSWTFPRRRPEERPCTLSLRRVG